MLKGVSPLIDPGLLHALARMGHGDVLAIVDRNYPAARHPRVFSNLGIGTTEAARAIFSSLPIDDFIEPALHRMVPDGETSFANEAHREFEREATEAEGRTLRAAVLERSEFYSVADSAFAVLQTGETRPFSCFLVTKGVL